MGKERLQDKIALVVGAGSRGEPAGTGYATAKLFARHGAAVLLVDNNPRARRSHRARDPRRRRRRIRLRS